MTKREFMLGDAELAEQPYHYTSCGLDNVYLYNGFEIKETRHGRGVSITNMDGLHKLIGKSIATKKGVILPKEMRFLRHWMKGTQAEFADLLGTDVQTVGRYERGETPITGPVDKIVKLMFLIIIEPEESREPLVKTLHQIFEESGAEERRDFEVTDDGWEPRLAA